MQESLTVNTPISIKMRMLNATQKGLITGIAIIAVMFGLFYKLNMQPNSNLLYIVFFIFTAGIIWSTLSFSRSADDQTKLSAYFSNGFKTFIVVTLFMVIYTFIFYKLNPGVIDAQVALNSQLMAEQHTHTQQEIDANAAQMKKIFMPMMLFSVTIVYLLLGSIITLLSSVIIKQLKKA